MRKRGGERTVALNIKRVVPDRRHDTENSDVVQDGDRHAAGTDADGKAPEANVKDAELRIDGERSGESL